MSLKEGKVIINSCQKQTKEGVACVIMNTRGEILFVVDKPVDGVDAPEWKRWGMSGIVFGGKENLEQPLNTAIREIEEEVGLSRNSYQINNKGQFVLETESLAIHINVFLVTLNEESINIILGQDIQSCNRSSGLTHLISKLPKEVRPGTIEAIAYATRGAFDKSNIQTTHILNGMYNVVNYYSRLLNLVFLPKK